MMQIRIAGKQIEIGEALPSHVRTRLTAAVAKHFDRSGEATVTFARERTGFRADCTLHLSSGVSLQSHGAGPTAYRAFDMTLDRLEKRVRRYARRLKNHHEHVLALPIRSLSE